MDGDAADVDEYSYSNADFVSGSYIDKLCITIVHRFTVEYPNSEFYLLLNPYPHPYNDPHPSTHPGSSQAKWGRPRPIPGSPAWACAASRV